jgi:hypothetical protein
MAAFWIGINPKFATATIGLKTMVDDLIVLELKVIPHTRNLQEN